MANKISTDDKIINAFKKLLIQNGYAETTTRKVAEEAQVNEVTIFRHFKNKENILKEIINRFLKQIENLNSTFIPTGHLEKDLIHISKEYYKQINKNKTFLILGLQLLHRSPKLNGILSELPRKAQKLAIYDFKALQNAGEINSDVDINAESNNFLLINYGHFIFKGFYKIGINQDEFIEQNIKTFIRHLE
ncbi:TetR family transcriptional regulator [Philodulcilactobacillus myokoensis]|uniref:TetR family transcriptional regulator n=1 Tax=Philodulcilactobacillus myokoensis TaxID=2929573 RepID=A0A9W6AZD8_9LACO|nr:TetR/AcrR family transcriptional regulator [Philodulcilactobacillus myokoensis]GLB46292.1 TetR family transcriptional regulator [Philodulcilactobacillus myokoensis]